MTEIIILFWVIGGTLAVLLAIAGLEKKIDKLTKGETGENPLRRPRIDRAPES